MVQTEQDTYTVLLDYASPQDSDTFIRAFQEIFEPVRDQRYLILRTEDRMPNLPLRMLWLPSPPLGARNRHVPARLPPRAEDSWPRAKSGQNGSRTTGRNTSAAGTGLHPLRAGTRHPAGCPCAAPPQRETAGLRDLEMTPLPQP